MDRLHEAEKAVSVEKPQRAQAYALIDIAKSLRVLAEPRDVSKTLREQIIDTLFEAARGTTTGATPEKFADSLLSRFDIKPKE